MKRTAFTLIGLAFLISFIGCAANGSAGLIKTVADFEKAVSNAMPGDTLILAIGEWKDADLVFQGRGTAEKPIVLRAEKAGKVILTGRSRLRLAGEYLVVSGLAFLNGSTPGNAVIEFRKDKRNLANQSRVTNCVIDNYNQKDRFDSDYWVLLYGRHNRFDHNYLARKKNHGVTLAVRLNDTLSQKNYHRIDHNFFGERPRLGANGGETLRVGVSTYSLTSSHTIIEDNYFYRCNGETEVASIKASDNIIRRNTFFECEGSLVMRHGNRNLVEGNFFIGNNLPETGGLRVINAGHKIYNNYFQDLKGDRFRAALAIMNGVPNSLINRYHKVKDVEIAFNTFINCDNIKIGVGSDYERTDVPQNTIITNNVFYHSDDRSPFTALDDYSGVEFRGNVFNSQSGSFRHNGFRAVEMTLLANANLKTLAFSEDKRAKQPQDKAVGKDIFGRVRDGINSPGAIQFGADDHVGKIPEMNSTGVNWYPREMSNAVGEDAKVITVQAGENTLVEALRLSQPGDIIELQESGLFTNNEPLEIQHRVILRAAEGLVEKPIIQYSGSRSRSPIITIENGGRLRLQGIAFDGTPETGAVAGYAIQSSAEPMIEHYSLNVEHCDFYDFQESRFNAFRANQSTYADSVVFRNCRFSKISGEAISMASEKEDRGKYNAEYLILENCAFYDVMGAAVNLYRGGNDESTFGPFLTVDHCVFDNVNNKEQGSVLRLIGVQVADIRNSIFSNSGKGGRSIKFEEFRWDHVKVSFCNIYNSGRVESFYDNVVGKGMVVFEPDYMDRKGGDFRLSQQSVLNHKASDGGPLGLSD